MQNKPVLTFQVNSCKVVLVPGGQVLQQVAHVHHVVFLINQIWKNQVLGDQRYDEM